MTNQLNDFSFTVSPEATASVHDDGVVILHLGNGRFYTCNGTGARIWRAIERRLSLDAIAQEISSAYEIALNTARQHTVRFLIAADGTITCREEGWCDGSAEEFASRASMSPGLQEA